MRGRSEIRIDSAQRLVTGARFYSFVDDARERQGSGSALSGMMPSGSPGVRHAVG